MRVLLFVLACFAAAAGARADTYRLDYTIELVPAEEAAKVTITVGGGGIVREVDFAIDAERHSALSADGRLDRIDGRAVWRPPSAGGSFRLTARIPSERRGRGYDAWIDDDFAIFRGDDVIPAASVRAERGARAQARLNFRLPPRWIVDTGWPRAEAGHFVIDNPERSFDRPVGWMIAGRLGIRRDFIDGTEVAVAAPRGSGFHRMDVLTFMNIVLPEFERAFETLPPKLLLVGAGSPMWRGGLSAPNSFFLHIERPLVSENGTSTLVHEMVHVVTRIRGAANDDWIAEGLAEYYAIELLRRAGGISDHRLERIREQLTRWSRDVERLRVRRSSGPITARAALLFMDLDREIRNRTDGAKNLDDVTRALIKRREVSLTELRATAELVAGGKLRTLDSALLR
jgi:predicted metalloprotease with PDZ domain